MKSSIAFEKIADTQLDAITGEIIGGFIAKRRESGLEVSSINRELQALRRMFHLAQEWGRVEKALPTVKMLPGEKHRERVLTAEEESGGAWVFPAPTLSGHIEPSSLKKQHAKAGSVATRLLREETGDRKRSFAGFELYTLRHTCLTRWAPHMDPWTLAYLAGHRDMNITKRYVHPQQQTILEAMEKA